MTISDKKLYVIFTNLSNIDVYDVTDGLHFLQRIPVEQIVSPFDIVATDNIFFVSEFENNLIRRIDLHGKIVNTLVVTDSNPQGITLSVTEKGNVIASIDRPSKLVEYTPTGKCVRTIVLEESLEGLRHGIQLNNDQFLVCHSSPTLDRVCLINSKGCLIKSVGNHSGSQLGYFNVPEYLVTDKNGLIYVADQQNNRIVQLNSSLDIVGELDQNSTGLTSPFRMFVDRDQGRFYVREYIDSVFRIVIFDIGQHTI